MPSKCTDRTETPKKKRKPFEPFLTYDNELHLYLEEHSFKSDAQLVRLKNWIEGALKYRKAGE